MAAVEHKVKHAVVLGSQSDPARQRYVVECVCGWSSRVHWSKNQANIEYAAHKEPDALRH